MAAPVPSTGFVATSPSWAAATAPLANELARATVVALALALVLGLPLAVALALAMPDADAVGWWCWPNAESATWTDALFTMMTVPIATPAATGMAITVAIRARRLLCERRRAVDRWPVSIYSPPCPH
jgi:ABC-type Fe3+ transport system permease subunit